MNALTTYITDDFGIKLKNIRIYRGYKSQAKLCKAIDIPRQTWCLWEQGRTKPTITQVTIICNFLKISPLYFFVINPEIEKYDSLFTPENKSALPFIDTEISKLVSKIFDLAAMSPGLYMITGPEGVGVSRSIYEKRKFRDDGPVIYDNIYNLTENELTAIIKEVNSPEMNTKSYLIISNENVPKPIMSLEFTKIFKLPSLNYDEFDRIIKAVLPGSPENVISLIHTVTRLDLNALSEAVNKIQQKKTDFTWEMNFKNVFLLLTNQPTTQ